jgi:hypothetical protein
MLKANKSSMHRSNLNTLLFAFSIQHSAFRFPLFFGPQQQQAWHRPLRRTLVLQMPWASAGFKV